MKQGQMEIFGMVFIVLLIFVGFFIWISLSPNPEPVSIGNNYERTKMATDFINAILRVSTNCSNQDLGYVLAACENPTIALSGLGCADPCQEAQDILAIGLDRTLGAMQYKYQLTFSSKSGSGFVTKFKIPDVPFSCAETVKTGFFPFRSHLTRNMLQLKLEICR